MYLPVKHERQKLLERIEKGEITIGKEVHVVPSSYQSYTVDSHTHNIQENTVHISARKICDHICINQAYGTFYEF